MAVNLLLHLLGFVGALGFLSFPAPFTFLPCLPAERTVALLAFNDPRSSPVGELMEVAQRQKTASELNAAILTAQVIS